MEDKGNDANAAHVCNNKVFEVAPLCGAKASWQRERWGDMMTDHVEDPVGNGEAGEGERGEREDSMRGRSATMRTSTSMPLPLLLPP